MKSILPKLVPSLMLSLFLAPLLLRAVPVTISYPDGPRTYVLELRADKTSAKPGDSVTFTVKAKIRSSRSDAFADNPSVLPSLKWTAASNQTSNLIGNRGKLTPGAGKLVVSGLTEKDNGIRVTVTHEIDSFHKVYETVEVPVTKPANGGGGGGSVSGGGGGVVGHAPIDVDPPSLQKDFVHAIRGAGSFPVGSRIELTVAFKKGAEGSQGVRIDWYKSNKLVKSNQARLVIDRLDAGQTGTYTAKVTRLQDGAKDQANAAVTLAKK